MVEGKSRQALLTEAAMQTRMIRNLERWLKLLTAFSGLGILLAWWGANSVRSVLSAAASSRSVGDSMAAWYATGRSGQPCSKAPHVGSRRCFGATNPRCGPVRVRSAS